MISNIQAWIQRKLGVFTVKIQNKGKWGRRFSHYFELVGIEEGHHVKQLILDLASNIEPRRLKRNASDVATIDELPLTDSTCGMRSLALDQSPETSTEDEYLSPKDLPDSVVVEETFNNFHKTVLRIENSLIEKQLKKRTK